MKKIFVALLATQALHAHAADSVALEAGRGGRDVWMTRVGAQWRWENERGYWDVAVAAWDGGRGTIYDLSVTPVFRLVRRGEFYGEGAIGAHWLSSTAIEPAREFSTHVQFGDHLGVGWQHGRTDLQLRLQHISNGGIRNPNPGINFLLLRLQYELR